MTYIESPAQIFSVGAGMSYKESFKEESITTKTINRFMAFRGAIYSQPFSEIPIKFGIDFAFGRKTLLDYSASPNQPLGTGSIDAQRSIKLIMIEMPFLYRVYRINLISFFCGGKIGLNNAKLDEHFMGQDYSNSSTSPIFGLGSEVGIELPLSFSIFGGINYRFLKNKIIDLRDYDFSGLWFDLKILYDF